MNKNIVALLMSGLAIAACQTSIDESADSSMDLPIGATLSGDQLRNELIGSRFAFDGNQGATANIRFTNNGDVRLSNATFPGVSSDRGTWRIDGNRLCVSWATIRDGEENCLRYVRGPEETYTTDTGTIRRL